MSQFPEVALFKSLAKEMRSIEEQFGMSPSARTKISISLCSNEGSMPTPDNGGKASRFDYSRCSA